MKLFARALRQALRFRQLVARLFVRALDAFRHIHRQSVFVDPRRDEYIRKSHYQRLYIRSQASAFQVVERRIGMLRAVVRSKDLHSLFHDSFTQLLRPTTTSGCANRLEHRPRSHDNDSSWYWLPTRSNRAERV